MRLIWIAIVALVLVAIAIAVAVALPSANTNRFDAYSRSIDIGIASASNTLNTIFG